MIARIGTVVTRTQLGQFRMPERREAPTTQTEADARLTRTDGGRCVPIWPSLGSPDAGTTSIDARPPLARLLGNPRAHIVAW
ncbi:hypothetical protein AB0C02_31805 [Micromonospora sp. NPDC048999]|uniref:hypothetical protein n=1 Tax=Micromonospora sp. NPDC048999 TaxID=3155391 RepID=UPI0033F73F7F